MKEQNTTKLNTLSVPTKEFQNCHLSDCILAELKGNNYFSFTFISYYFIIWSENKNRKIKKKTQSSKSSQFKRVEGGNVWLEK